MMKVNVATCRKLRTVTSVAGWLCVAAACWVSVALAADPAGPSDRPEAYFNGSSYIRLTRPVSLKQLVGLSFRTCVGGELFSQRFEVFAVHVTAVFERVVVHWAGPGGARREVAHNKQTLDNQWHWVALRYRPNPPSLLLEVDHDAQVVSNVTWNPELLMAGGGAALVGSGFSGCLHEGPQLEFHVAHAQTRNVLFGRCPLTTDQCTDKKDVLWIPPKDHCYNEPCMRHGTCISRPDKYECHCTARYTGNNCEVDAGDPCRSAPCANGGLCQEDVTGDFKCLCPPRYHGVWCEIEASLDPLCAPNPCRNNGSCSVPPPATTYVCACPPGFTGRNCETDVDECAGGAGACLHGGRCVDAVNNYTCNCTNTGYTGARCEVNVNECEEDPTRCGHGVCYDTYGGFVCACQPGYTGEQCHRMSACASGPCGPGGACVEEGGGGGFRCVCARGWAPPLCLAPLAPLAPPASPPPPATCADLDCPPHSHCHDPFSAGMPTMVTGVVVASSPTCVCDPGYFGVSGVSANCTSAESACAGGVCQHGGTCLATHDALNCTCATGYRGEYCEVVVAASSAGGGVGAGAAGKALSDLRAGPEPERCAAAPCLHALSCLDTPTGFECECESGWSGARCEEPGAGADCPRACLNGGTCRDGQCDCRDGYAGPTCDVALDCRATGCPPHQECVEGGSDGGEGWGCSVSAATSACASAPCHNGSCVATDGDLYRCQCAPGYTGRLCEVDVDECTLKPKICNHGVCMNVPGSYQCYCKPGFTGDNCDQDIDECLSSPCKNGGVCQNLQNNYECTCMEGFDGKDCSMNIDECEGAPCAAGATCVDGVANYTCLCPEGLAGPKCETDIDDCQSEPCQHGGRCVDALNSYSCECEGTGYTGDDCALNIDDCAPQPCQRGGTCVDLVNDYRCTCHPAYTGKNCEVDIPECERAPCKFGGVCLELSNATLYRAREAPPLVVGPQPHMLLPQLFYQPFSLENAAGFVCVCVEGTEGARCEVNVDECVSSPCAHGKCVDGIGSYACECLPGYEGDHCEQDINECERYRPCAHGRCYDGQASYYCECEAGYGGQNCSVVLVGCHDEPCRNHGTCRPWLHRETDHRFNCSCAPGHHGTTCEKVTTMSLEKSSYVEVNTTREEGYEISFRFKTTLGNGLLAMGRGLTYFFLELSSGRLNLHSSLLNKWEGVFIGSNLNDSNWQKVFVAINASHLVLAANEEQTIYPISQNEAFNSSVTSFPSTRLGTAGSSYATLTHGPNFFIGCFQDVIVNRQWVLPEDSSSNGTEVAVFGDEGVVAQLVGVLASCPRSPQCAPNPCRSGGACEDHWTSFLCTCPRPHLGLTCQYNYTAATFGHESAAGVGVVTVVVSESARRTVHAALDVSMFIRTRKPTGHIFYLGSARNWVPEATVVGASLKGGELLLQLRFNQTPEDYTVGGTRLDNGHLHLIEVVRNSTLVQVKLNGTEYFRKSISAAKQLDAEMLYLGGPPPLPAALFEAPAAPLPPTAAPSANPVSGTTTASPLPSTVPPSPLRDPTDADYFKGVIQDVQVSNGVNVSIVEFFPLLVEGLHLPPPFGVVSFDPAAVLRGVVSDDACASHPCLHNATCTVTWNDYACVCPRGYKGKQCAEVEFCQLQACPPNSHCRNLDGGYECVSNGTFDGATTVLSYRLRRPAALALPAPHAADLPADLTITYRSKVGGTMFVASSSEWVSSSPWWFSVGVFRGRASLAWRLPRSPLPQLHRLPARPSHPADAWTTLKLTFAQGLVKGAWVEGDTHEETVLSEEIDVEGWQRLVQQGYIQLGGVRQPHTEQLENSTETTLWDGGDGGDGGDGADGGDGEEPTDDNVAGRFFKGCLGGVWLGGLLLPYFTEEELFMGATAALLAAQPHYVLRSGRPWEWSSGVGCVLCLESECQRGGRCADVRSSYACDCVPGYAGDYCEIDVDECVGHECRNGATCEDEVAGYTCLCPQGFDGTHCEHDVDECLSGPCLHGGTCADEPGGFTCACPSGWRGERCAEPRSRSCAHRPCAEGRGQCRDNPTDPVTGNNYTCECFEGFSGPHCETAFCEAQPCAHGTCRTDQEKAECVCLAGWTGQACDEEVDECLSGGAAACLHGGLCRDQLAGFSCDCTGTGWTGAYCEVDVDECAGLVTCLPGECRNTDGGYTCICSGGFCGHECALRDPCYTEGEGEGMGANATGPCRNGALCEQRCAAVADYYCECVDGWGGKNCTQQIVSEGALGGEGQSSTVLIAVGAALLALLVGGAGLLALGVQARRKRATRGTYSPSGQEYCNPRAEMMHNALKPPPEERLI